MHGDEHVQSHILQPASSPFGKGTTYSRKALGVFTFKIDFRNAVHDPIGSKTSLSTVEFLLPIALTNNLTISLENGNSKWSLRLLSTTFDAMFWPSLLHKFIQQSLNLCSVQGFFYHFVTIFFPGELIVSNWNATKQIWLMYKFAKEKNAFKNFVCFCYFVCPTLS